MHSRRKDHNPIDVRLPSDLATGRLDSAIKRALDDEKQGSTRQL